MAITKIQSESLNLADTYDFTGTVTGAGESNTPAFSAHRTSQQNLGSAGSVNKMIMNVEDYDTDSAYDTSNGRFTVPTGKGGKYHFDIVSNPYEVSNNIYDIHKNSNICKWFKRNTWRYKISI